MNDTTTLPPGWARRTTLTDNCFTNDGWCRSHQQQASVCALERQGDPYITPSRDSAWMSQECVTYGVRYLKFKFAEAGTSVSLPADSVIAEVVGHLIGLRPAGDADR